jgi:hypothetical protein
VTTVVANRECIAADNRITGGGPMCHVQKIHKIKGSLFGFAGHASLCYLMFKWLSGPRDIEQLHKLVPPDYRDDFDVLELGKDGLAHWNGWGVRMPLMDNSYAIGSGAPAALAAVRQGEAPEKALKHAFGLDECSGVFFQPQVEWLKPKK